MTFDEFTGLGFEYGDSIVIETVDGGTFVGVYNDDYLVVDEMSDEDEVCLVLQPQSYLTIAFKEIVSANRVA